MRIDASVPAVSVVIPTHGRCALLARLLASLERQSLDGTRYEVIIVHNYTPDGTQEMATAWCARQPFRATYYRKDYNGPARSRDFGARAAQGRYVAFTDDDCVATPEWLAAGVAAFAPAKSDPAASAQAVGLVQGRTLPIPTQRRRFPDKTIVIGGPTVFYETCNIFYAKEAFLAVRGFSEDFLDEFYGEDTDLGWKVTGHGYRAVFAPDALVHHEVFRVSIARWLAEPLYFKNLPYLVAKYPALRRFMYHRYFLTRDTCLFNVSLVAALVAVFVPWAGALLTLPYLVERYRSGAHVGAPWLRAARVAAGIPRGFVMWWALCRGSLRARTFLL